MRLYRKLPADERRKGEDSEYIFEHRTEQGIPVKHQVGCVLFSRL